jgi:hypothetical protein
MTEELRLYTFTLYQLSPIQQGIQAGHAAIELGMKAYKKQMTMRQGAEFTTYHRWATEWKTLVLLNGGDYTELRELADFLSSYDNPYPVEILRRIRSVLSWASDFGSYHSAVAHFWYG